MGLGDVMVATPYSTGGGGTVLEHRYGAFVLAHVLSGAPLYELDGLTAPTAVRFQAGAESAVDDLVIRGVRADGTERTAAVAVRRDPDVVRSSDKTRTLVSRFLSVLDENLDDVQRGSFRLGLAAAATSSHAADLAELSGLAAQRANGAAFREAIPNQQLRGRLEHVDGLVKDSTPATGWQMLDPGTMDVSWLLLKYLHVRMLRLEGGEQSDWTSAVTLLTPLTGLGTAEAGATAADRIAVLVGDYAPSGSEVLEEGLRSDLGALLAADIWVDGLGRRVAREPEILRYMGAVVPQLTSVRQVARESLGLSPKQVELSFNAEPPGMQALTDLPPGALAVLLGPVGSGKTDAAIRWLLDGYAGGFGAWGRPIPVFIRAAHLQSTLDAAVQAAVGFSDAPQRFGVDLVIDGLDETPGASPVTHAMEFLKVNPKSRVVITARQGEFVPKNVKTIEVQRWSLDEVRALVGAVLEIEPWRVGHGWTPDFFEAARRPLFALLAASYSESGSGVGPSLVDRAVRDALTRVSSRTGLESLALATIRAGHGVAASALTGVVDADLLASRLVELDGPRLRFVLPIFEQWFAAQAVLSGSVSAEEFLDETGFARWRYVLAIAVSSGAWEETFPWLDTLVRTNPAAGAWVVKEAVRSDLRSTASSTSTYDKSTLPDRLWSAMSAWMAGLDWASPYLGPGFALGATAPGTLDGVRLAVGMDEPGRITTAWLQREAGGSAVQGNLPAADEMRRLPQRTSWGPAPDSEVWPWRHTLEHMDRKALEHLLMDGQFLPILCPPAGIVRSEYESWFSIHALGFNDIWPACVTAEMATEKIRTLLGEVASSGEGQIVTRGFRVTEVWLRALASRLESEGDSAIADIWPGPDLPAQIGGARAYTDERALARANAVYAATATAYEELRMAYFPRFGRLLPHAATFPAVLVGHFESGMGGPLGGDLGWASIDHWMRPVRDRSQDVPLISELKWGRSEGGGLWAQSGEEASKVFMARRRDDPLGSAFELTSIQNAVVHNEFWGRRPATHIAISWLLHDLAEYGWLDSGSSLVRLK